MLTSTRHGEVLCQRQLFSIFFPTITNPKRSLPNLQSLCNSVQYNARPAAEASPAQGDCILYRENLSATNPNAQYDFAVQVDPPTHEEDDYPSHLCTTACPFADGMFYSSSYGENFKMDCGKRHGTKYLTTAQADNFRDCESSYIPFMFLVKTG